MMGKKLWETISKIKNVQWIAVLMLAGVLLIILSNALTPGAGPAPQETGTPQVSPSPQTLEERLESVLSMVAGAGKVRVLVNTQQLAPAAIGGQVGEEITGIIVVAEGGENLSVRLELARAVQSLLDVPQSNIEILTMEKEDY